MIATSIKVLLGTNFIESNDMPRKEHKTHKCSFKPNTNLTIFLVYNHITHAATQLRETTTQQTNMNNRGEIKAIHI